MLHKAISLQTYWMNGRFHSNNLHQIIWILGNFPSMKAWLSFSGINLNFIFFSFFRTIYRQRIDIKNVSLENVIVKEIDSIAVGTIKVKNLSFHKEVIVRSTWDNWKTQQDTICTYTPVRIFKFSLPDWETNGKRSHYNNWNLFVLFFLLSPSNL